MAEGGKKVCIDKDTDFCPTAEVNSEKVRRILDKCGNNRECIAVALKYAELLSESCPNCVRKLLRGNK